MSLRAFPRRCWPSCTTAIAARANGHLCRAQDIPQNERARTWLDPCSRLLRRISSAAPMLAGGREEHDPGGLGRHAWQPPPRDTFAWPFFSLSGRFARFEDAAVRYQGIIPSHGFPCQNNYYQPIEETTRCRRDLEHHTQQPPADDVLRTSNSWFVGNETCHTPVHHVVFWLEGRF